MKFGPVVQEEMLFKEKVYGRPTKTYHYSSQGAQWLSGRVLDSRPKGRGFEPHCVVVLEQVKHIYPSLVLVQPR